MEGVVVILLGILLLFLVFVIRTIIAFFQIGTLKRELREVRGELEAIRDRLDESPIPDAPPPQPYTASPAPPHHPAVTQPPAAPDAAAPPPITSEEPDRVPPPVISRPAVDPVATHAAPPHIEPRRPPETDSQTGPAFNWEQFFGVRLFAWIGGLGLFLGIAFFVRYSFEHDLVPPEVRVALGFLAGIGLVVGGVILTGRGFRVPAHTLCATGVLALYGVTYACRSVYHFAFFGTVPTFAIMVLVTATAFALAVRLHAQVVAVLGVLGGFLTPVILSTGVDYPLGLFGYLALLNIGLVAVANRASWPHLTPLAAAGTALLQLGWVSQHFAISKIPVALIVFLLFPLMHLGAEAWRRRNRDPGGAWWIWAIAILLASGFLFALWTLGLPELSRPPWMLFAIVFGLNTLALGAAGLDSRAGRMFAGSSFAALLWTGFWMRWRLDDANLNALLALILALTIVQVVVPLLRPARFAGALPAWWVGFAPVAATGVLLMPLLRLAELGPWIWIPIVLVNLVAVWAAAATGMILWLIAVLALNLFGGLAWIVILPADTAFAVPVLLVIALLAVVFTGGLWLVRRLTGGSGLTDHSADAMDRLPGMAALFPFVLLAATAFHLPLEDPAPLFGLGLLLGALVFGLALRTGPSLLPVFAVAGLFAVQWAWFQTRMESGHASSAAAWFAGINLLVLGCPFVFRRSPGLTSGAWIAGALAGPVQFFLMYLWMRRNIETSVPGLLPVAWAGVYLAALAGVMRVHAANSPERNRLLAWYGGVALLFISLVFPIQFDRQWITIGWAAEGAALLWLYRRVGHPGLRPAGFFFLVAAFVRLALNPEILAYQAREAIPVFNWLLYTYGLVIAALMTAFRFLAPPDDHIAGLPARKLCAAMAGILAFILLNLQIADYFSPPGYYLTLEFSANFARDMVTSIGWALFALGLVGLGIWKNVRGARLAGIGLLTVTLGKLFLHDLANLGPLHRIGAFMTVAAVSILASFLYQKFLPPPQSDE